MTVAVLVDSSSCITREVAGAYHLRVVPLHLIWGNKEYADWVDMTPEEFYARIKAEKVETWPTTSGSVQGEFLKIFEELRGKVDGVVRVLHRGTGHQAAGRGVEDHVVRGGGRYRVGRDGRQPALRLRRIHRELVGGGRDQRVYQVEAGGGLAEQHPGRARLG